MSEYRLFKVIRTDGQKYFDIEYVRDVVTCGECKYYEAKEDWCYWRDEAITADDFCSYGCRDSEKPNNSERSSE